MFKFIKEVNISFVVILFFNLKANKNESKTYLVYMYYILL